MQEVLMAFFCGCVLGLDLRNWTSVHSSPGAVNCFVTSVL